MVEYLKHKEQKPTNMNTAPTVFNVTDAVCVSNDINSTKNAILQYGAVTSGYYEDIKYQSDDQNSYYCPTKVLIQIMLFQL